MSSLPDAEHAAVDADAELLRRLASGDRDALDALYRRHEEYARRVATAVSGGDLGVADDLMAEAFAAVFRRAASNAPIMNFRAYLSACIRNAHLAHLRDGARSSPASDQPWLFDTAVDDDPYLVDGIDGEHAIAALAALPAGWRELLWRIEVEGRTNAELADLMGKSHSAVSSMAHRAREGLRRAFLDRHVPATRASACRWTRQHLSRYVRSELSDRAAGRVRSHVSECGTCARVLQDLESLNRRIGASLWPVVLAGAGPTLPMVPNPDGSSTPSADASSVPSISPSAPPPAGPFAALAGASPVTIATVVGVAAAVVFAASAVAMKLTGTDEAGEASGPRPAAATGGAAGASDQAAATDADPPAGPLAGPAAPLSAEPSEKDEEEEEEEEDEDRPRRSAALATTSTSPPTYDASISSVDVSSVSGQGQSVTFVVQMNSAGPRTGLVVDLAITVDSTDSTDWRFAVDQVSGSGWTCRAPNGDDVAPYVFEAGTTLTCSYEFSDESGPPALGWDLLFDDADGQVDGVTGSARITVVGRDDPNAGNDTKTF